MIIPVTINLTIQKFIEPRHALAIHMRSKSPDYYDNGWRLKGGSGDKAKAAIGISMFRLQPTGVAEDLAEPASRTE